ncbi:hypothetical protein [Haloferax profundi]|uniref:hypothetical protein n=1 Tax=Haloferax profundi TaxID=1544718 RepID=UPI002F3FDAFA
MPHPYHSGFVPLSSSVVDDADCPRSRSNRFDVLDPPVRAELLVERVRLLRDDDRFEDDVDDRLEDPRDERVREDVLALLDDPVEVLDDDRFEDDVRPEDVRPDDREDDERDVDEREDDDRAEDDREERDEDDVDRDEEDDVDRDEEDDELVDVLPLPACPGNLNLVRPSSRFST